jgi:hypothetical protein
MRADAVQEAKKLERCLILLETPGIEGNRIGPPIDPRSGYSTQGISKSAGTAGYICSDQQKTVALEAIET